MNTPPTLLEEYGTLHTFSSTSCQRWYCGLVVVQNAAAEYRLYRQMALVSSAMAFSWSKWNADIDDRERIFLQAAEHTIDQPLTEVRLVFARHVAS